MDSSPFDLNSLRALEIVLREKHVSRAAQLANLSQPAMSRILARLRETFGDDLLVRGPRGYELTARALALREPVDRILDEVKFLQQPPNFSAARVSEQITLVALDVELQLFVPYLFKRMRRESPHASLRPATHVVACASEPAEYPHLSLLASAQPFEPAASMVSRNNLRLREGYRDHRLTGGPAGCRYERRIESRRSSFV